MAVKVRERPKDSGIYWIFIDHQGKRKSKKVGRDKRLAQEAAKKIEAKLVLGELQIGKTEAPCPTFMQYADKWHSLPHDWKESTRELYCMNLRKHVYPVLGKIYLNEINRKEIKQLLDNLLISGLATSTVKNVRITISGVLESALEEELISHNPLNDLKFKYNGKKQDDINPLTAEEAGALLEQAESSAHYPPLFCALVTGMRIGEIEALQWGDVDFHGGFLELKRSHRRGRITDTKNHLRRHVDMTPKLAMTLQRLKTDRKIVLLENDWVFASKEGKMLNRNSFRRTLQRCLKRAGLRRVRIHDLRHSYATIRLLKGHNIGDVSYQLGHSSIKITYDTYGHWMPGHFKSEVEELDELLQPNATYTQPELLQVRYEKE